MNRLAEKRGGTCAHQRLEAAWGADAEQSDDWRRRQPADRTARQHCRVADVAIDEDDVAIRLQRREIDGCNALNNVSWIRRDAKPVQRGRQEGMECLFIDPDPALRRVKILVNNFRLDGAWIVSPGCCGGERQQPHRIVGRLRISGRGRALRKPRLVGIEKSEVCRALNRTKIDARTQMGIDRTLTDRFQLRLRKRTGGNRDFPSLIYSAGAARYSEVAEKLVGRGAYQRQKHE